MNLIPEARLTSFINEIIQNKDEWKSINKMLKHKSRKHIEISKEARQEIQLRVAIQISSMLDLSHLTKERRNTILKRDLKV